ncbi:ion transporter [Tsukamurella sp. 8F]|uniref:ion transporter n=1 Tax=unclassified Tsukamurella TaxID=2633480 RepID=UPI0023B90EAE|nr:MULTISPECIES: ion transporter [unclassified Tsukamurella]MDF0530462.1 ion transporter [Tsukamurella sp. 8J]MDF0587717.1 ion transporter [Tsukamurella sp. 8F]
MTVEQKREHQRRSTLADYPSKPPVGVADWTMLVIALVSVVLLCWVTFGNVSPEVERRVIIADYVICGVFAIEFVWRWRRSGEGWRFPVRYWYEVLGMIPVSDPLFRSFRLLRIVLVLARLGRAADRAFGDRVTATVLQRSTDALVETIKRPITIAVMDEVAAVLRTGRYTQNIASALEENRGEIDEMIVELVKQDSRIGRLRWLPFHDDVVRLVSDTVFRLVFEVLRDPRTDELVADALRENIDQMRAAVRERDREAEADREAAAR